MLINNYLIIMNLTYVIFIINDHDNLYKSNLTVNYFNQ